MAPSLSKDFATLVKGIEAESQGPWENARFSDVNLRQHRIHSIYLVTDAWHLRHAFIAVAAIDVAVVAVPADGERPPSLRWREFVPQVSAWRLSSFALHEWLGSAYYELRRWLRSAHAPNKAGDRHTKL
jgi:uncharacterized SAM-binding protein YcdF (DUF218 family)